MPLATLCYASQAAKPDHLVREDLMDIINTAVRFNAEHQIYGVLYYGNGYFFQCLEGEREVIENLYYDHILADARHQKALILKLDDIEEIQFLSWHMKFAPYHQEIMDFFNQQGSSQFDPYALTEKVLPEFLNILHHIEEEKASA